MLMARGLAAGFSMFYLNLYWHQQDLLRYVYRELPSVMENAICGLGIDSKVVFDLITFPGEE